VVSERGVLIAGNWKMHLNHFEALKYIQELAALLRAHPLPSEVELSVHPPFTSLRSVQTAVETDHIGVALGAQNCHFEARGAFTGEVSAEMLAKLNVTYVIAGHSERRQLFGETDEIVRKKLDAILSAGMRPVLCVGESAEEREAGIARSRVGAQLEAALGGRRGDQLASIVVAYEPIWAIGTGTSATAADAEEMCGAIREDLTRLGRELGASARVLYGGSVTPDNAAELLGCPHVDGALVGGASLDAAKFHAIAMSHP
jgi:triosephosphate isomerase